MSPHPDKELLSAHADASVPTSERAGLEEHLASCADCRKELAELKAVSKLVADLPQAELPVGFMARLERRRREGEAAPAAFTFPGHSPWRLAGFAATGILVGLIFFREVRYRLAPEMLGDAAYLEGDTGIQSSTPEGFSDDSADVAAARQAAVSRGAWNGLSDAESAPAAPAPQGAAESAADERAEMLAMAKSVAGASSVLQSAPARARIKAGGAPLGAEGSTASNEQLQAQLEEQKRLMGIREIVSPGAGAAANQNVPGPLSKSEAMDYMRSMTRQLSKLNQDANAKKRPTVEIGVGATPRIIGLAEQSQPLGADGKKDVAKAKAADKGSLGMVRGSVRVDEPASFEPPPLRRADFSAQKVVASAPAAPAALAAGAAGAPAKPIVPRGFWSSTQGGPGNDGGAVITKAEDWADLWSRLSRAEALPAADFSKEMAVAVFASRDEHNRRAVEIVSLVEEGGRLVIKYRLKDEGVKAPSAPYHVVIAPKSELPYEFVLVK